jgi:3-dehydroquinate synthase
VAEDERESGCRALLNLGHTFGHAFEAETGYGASLHEGEATLLHGEAVAMGMAIALDLSASIGVCPPEDAARLRTHMEAVGLIVDPRHLPGAPDWDVERLLEHMGHDKKVLWQRALVRPTSAGIRILSGCAP